MSEEYQGGVCGGNWWINSSTNLFRSSPCSSAINDPAGSFGWLNNEPIIDMSTTRSKSDDSAGSASDGSIVLQDVQNPSDENISIFSSTLQTMRINHSSSSTITDDSWNHNIMYDNIGRSEQSYSNQMLINSSMNANYGQNSYTYNNSSFLQTLYDTDSQTDQQLLIENNQSTVYTSSPNYMNSTEFCPSLTKLTSTPSLPNNNFQFINNMPFWNDLSPSSQPQLALPSPLNSTKSNLQSLSTKQRDQENGGLNSAASKKTSHELPVKRSRIETQSPLPTFKVRKEKLGDRVTALQQLVSPFGKTDTASVLHEAIEYIKFLHDQVSVLSAPYLENGSAQLQNHQQAVDKNKDENKEQIQDLKSKGLCLVPISSTFPVAPGPETTTDFWTPTFGGCFRKGKDSEKENKKSDTPKEEDSPSWAI